ncbi:MAG: YerC/YecD family TrpR-related protein [Clostridia bacterium]|nr:YerC/YecD family TrpR-related protein [Clostridia bacterium]
MSRIASDSLDRLFDVILNLHTKDECYSFFEDLCTMRELKDLSARLDVAVLLEHGQNYQQVADETGVSSATISRVKRALEYGSGGYKLMISRMEEKK